MEVGCGCGRRGLVEQQYEAGTGGEVAFGRVPQAEVASLVEAFGQHMLEEAADEFVAGDLAGPPPRGFALLVSDRHGFVFEVDDPGVGDGDTEDVAAR